MRCWLGRLAVFALIGAWSWSPLACAEDVAAPTPAPSAPLGAAPTNAKDDPVVSEADVRLVSGEESAAADPKADGGPQKLPSAAERIARLERSIEADAKRLDELHESLDSPDGDYSQAETDFGQLDAQRSEQQQKLAAAQQTGQTDEAARLADEMASLEKKWTLAKERFDLAIKERKAAQQSVVTLEQKLQSDRESLAKLKGTAQPVKLESAPAAPPVESATPEAAPAPIAAIPAPAVTPAAPSVPAPVAAPPAPIAPAAPAPGQVAVPANPAVPVPPVADPAPPVPNPQPAPATAANAKISAELAVASATAQKSHEMAIAAEDEARTIGERVEILKQDIDLQRQLRETMRKKVDNADETLKDLNAELFRKLMSGENIDAVKHQIEEATARLADGRKRSREIVTRLDDLQSTLALLQAEQLTAASEATRMREAAQHDQATVDRLQNPFALRNVLSWLSEHGPRIVVILVALATLLWLIRVLEVRLINLIAMRGRRGSREDRENRAKTLLGVFHNVANMVVVGGGIVMLLDEIGIGVTPVIGGAAVIGLAVAFGAEPDQGLLHWLHGPSGTAILD